MPCDGSFVMRKIYTPTAKPLDDIKIILGNDNKELGFAEYATPNYIAGSFIDTTDARYYLLGKYEISQLQYQSVMNDKCPTPKLSLLMPITGISWFDAVSFSNKYTQWLLKHHPKVIPHYNQVPGYLRLPTNNEWEYALRGGVNVSESEFREQRFPMQKGSIEQYAWFSGAKSANGKLQLIGRLEPNPLGLHDMLGNASEMMFDSFKMNKLDRYHGQQGAMTVRGGSYLTSESQLASSLRLEKPYYDSNTGLAYQSKDLGFRLALTSEVIASNTQIQALDKEWLALGNTSGNDNNVVGELEKITDKVNDEKTKKELNQLNNLLRSANQARDEQRDRSIQSALQLGAFLCANVSDLQSKFEYNNNLYSLMTSDICDMAEADSLNESNICSLAKLNNLKSTVAESEAARDFILKYYADTIVNTSSNYAKNNIDDQVITTTFILDKNGKANIADYLKLHIKHINTYFKTGKVDRSIWLQQCNDIKNK
ncbi:SUMF1/EgtB/PvdO family nonheme iron enzyme [Orbus wheelerorum]|uniref:SUMF1/EgtB/PvdO family nonheme iron enzyme n=1 Tax=Orbus wheelerorum TaxID=3074111 RepID=UPI00370D11F9